MLRLTLLTLLLTLTNTCRADNNTKEYKQAFDYSVEAAYIQMGLDQTIQYKVEVLQSKIPKEYKKTLDLVVPIIDTLIKKRIEVRYEF